MEVHATAKRLQPRFEEFNLFFKREIISEHFRRFSIATEKNIVTLYTRETVNKLYICCIKRIPAPVLLNA